jgi:hypothetical protein
VFEFVPALAPFNFHWYAGADPPFAGVAVNVTDDPGQNGLDDAVMLTPAVNTVFTTIMIVMLDAGLPDVHNSDEVRIQ